MADIDFAALARQEHEQGLIPTPPSTLYFTYTRPDGDTFVGRATAALTLLRQGFTIGEPLTIENLVEWNETNATKEAAPAKRSSSKEE